MIINWTPNKEPRILKSKNKKYYLVITNDNTRYLIDEEMWEMTKHVPWIHSPFYNYAFYNREMIEEIFKTREKICNNCY